MSFILVQARFIADFTRRPFRIFPIFTNLRIGCIRPTFFTPSRHGQVLAAVTEIPGGWGMGDYT